MRLIFGFHTFLLGLIITQSIGAQSLDQIIVFARQEPQWFCKTSSTQRHRSMQRMMRTWMKATEDTEDRSYTVRVLLDQVALDTDHEWHLESQSGFRIHDQSARTWSSCKTQHIRITVRNGMLYVNDRCYMRNSVIITPHEGHIDFGQYAYRGSCILTATDTHLCLINSLDLEEYICGVLSTESWPGWPLEVNKVLAIAARSYALAMIMRCKYTKLPYHIRNSNYHQTYGGVRDNPVHRAAVQETRGIFLAYEDQPIIAMFDSCCGGVIPAHIADASVREVPYLARSYACTYCKKCKIYRWNAEYTTHEFLQKIKKEAPHVHKLKHVSVARKDKAGLVLEVKCKGSGKHSASIPGKRLYSLLKEVKSFCFTITHQADRVRIEGRGFGHHLGLCQWGACEMVRDRKDHRKILEFYYPGTTFMKLV